MRQAWIGILASMLIVAACSSDDDGGGKYAGVDRWECYELQPGCECVGLGAGDKFATSQPSVASCDGYDCCFAYKDESGGWTCTCLAPASACEPRDSWKEVASVSKCAPE